MSVNFYAKKMVYHATILILLNLSFLSPSIAMEAAEFWERVENIMGKPKPSATQSWGEWLMDYFVSVKPSKTAWEAARDPLFYQALYQNKINKLSKLDVQKLEHKLDNLLEFVGLEPLVSPLIHFENLKNLQESAKHERKAIIKIKQREFIENLHQKEASFLKKSFQHDFSEFLSNYNKYNASKLTFDLKNLLSFYATYQNPLDYLQSVNDFYAMADANQATYQLSLEELAEIKSSITNKLKQLQREPNFQERFQKALNNQASTKPVLDEADNNASDSEKTSVLTKMANGAYGMLQYAIKNPKRVMTIILATQAAAAAAIEQFTISSSGFDTFPVTVKLADKNALVAWGISNGKSHSVHARVYSPEGTSVSDRLNITQPMNGELVTMDASELKNRNLIFAWSVDSYRGTELYYQVTSSKGDPIGPILKVYRQFADIKQLRPSVVSMPNDNFFMVWNEIDISNKILGSLFAPDGTPIGEPIDIDEGYCNPGRPSFALAKDLPNGDVLAVVWCYWSPVIFYRTCSQDGKLSPIVLITDKAMAINYSEPQNLLMDSQNHNVTIMHYEADSFFAGNTLSTGLSVTNQVSFRLNSDMPNYGINSFVSPAFAKLRNGDVLVTWASDKNDVLVSFFTAAGEAISDVFQISDSAVRMSAIDLDDGNALVVINRSNRLGQRELIGEVVVTEDYVEPSNNNSSHSAALTLTPGWLIINMNALGLIMTLNLK